MKVAYLLGTLNRGGVETLMLDYFSNVSSLNFEIIGIYRNEGVLSNLFKETAVDLFQLKPKNKFGIFNYLKELRKFLLLRKVNLVHAQLPLDALYARLALLGTDVKVILTFHGYDNYKSSIYNILIKYIAKRTDLNIYVSRAQQAYYVNKYGLEYTNQEVIPNGISFNKFIIKESNSIRKEFDIKEGVLLLGMVGSFLPIRDQLFVCEFLAGLNKLGQDFRFLFIGNASDEYLYNTCVSFCSENDLEQKVVFLGQRNDVPELLVQLDAFVYASNFDTFGIAVVEAMASGVPVFVNDLPVMLEITNQGLWTNIYSSKNVDDLLLKFKVFLKDIERCKAKSMQTADLVKQKYSLDRHLKCLEVIYERIS